MHDLGIKNSRSERETAGEGHSAPVTHVDFRRDGRRLTTCSHDGIAIVWDTTEPTRPIPVTRLRHQRLIGASAWNPADPQLLATASDRTVGVWCLTDGGTAELISMLTRHGDHINSIGWMPDGKRLVCVSENGRATMWEASTGALLTELGSHAAHCVIVSVSSRGLVATVSRNGVICVIDPESDNDPVTHRYDSPIEGCAWSHAGDVLALTRGDGCVDLLSPELSRLRRIPLSASAAGAVSWADDDSSLVVGVHDGSLHFVDSATGHAQQVSDPRLWPQSVSVARDMVAVGSFWSGPHILDLTRICELAAPWEATHRPNALAVLDDKLFAGCDSGAILAIGLPGDGGQPVVDFRQVTESPVLSMAVHARELYLGTYSGHVVRACKTPLSSEYLGAPISSLCVDGGVLVAGTYSGEFLALDPFTLEVTSSFLAHEGSIRSVAALPGGGFISGSADRTVAVGTYRERSVIWEHGNLVNSVAALPGQVVASAARDHTVKVGRLIETVGGGWRAENVLTLLGPDEPVTCVGLLGDAAAPVVLAGSADRSLYAWKVDWQSSGRFQLADRLLTEFRQGLSCMVRLSTHLLAACDWDGKVVIVGLDRSDGVQVLSSMHLRDMPWS